MDTYITEEGQPHSLPGRSGAKIVDDSANREAHLRRVIDNMLGFVGILDPEGCLLDVNDTALQIGGHCRRDVIGRRLWDLPWFGRDRLTAAFVRDQFARAATGETVRYDVTVDAGGGCTLDIDMMLRPVIDADGRISCIIPSAIDVGDRKRAETRLAASEQRLAVGIHVGQLAIGRVDYRSQTVELSGEAAGLYGFGSEPITVSRQQLHRTFHPDDWLIVQRQIEALVAPGEIDFFQLDHRVALPDGREAWLEVRKQVYFDEHGQPSHAVFAARDVSDRKQSERLLLQAVRRAEEANRSKDLFLANMSHEIRTPMTAILGYSDLIAESVTDPRAKSYLEVIRENGRFLLSIIDDILDLSKIDTGKLTIHLAPFSPARLVEDVRTLMLPRALDKGLQLATQLADDLPPQLMSDPQRIKQILVNLVSNAIKFTDRGIVSIEAAWHDRQFILKVKDTGIGISRAELVRLFRPFTQADEGINRRFGGTGLGLVISHRLAKLLDGEIEIESEEGRGSRFSVRLPAKEADANVCERPSQYVAGRPVATKLDDQLHGRHILVVDDRREIRFLTRKLLEKAGAAVTEAEDGQQALEIIRATQDNGRFALILLDMQMPVLDGYQTARQARQDGFTRPIVALTANAMQGDMERCLRCGCDAYLQKPINVGALFTTVGRLLSTSL